MRDSAPVDGSTPAVRLLRAALELLSAANIKESVNQAYLVERGEPVYGPNGEKKAAFFVD